MSEQVYGVAIAFKMTEQLEQWICIRFCVKHEHSSDDSEGCSYGQLVIGSFITTTHLLLHQVLYRDFGETSNHPGDSVPLQPRFGGLKLLTFPKTKITFEKKRFQTIDGIQENTARQLMVIGRTV